MPKFLCLDVVIEEKAHKLIEVELGQIEKRAIVGHCSLYDWNTLSTDSLNQRTFNLFLLVRKHSAEI